MTSQPADESGLACFTDRKRIELAMKMAGLGTEFANWIDEAQPRKPLRKHASQLRRLTDQLGGMADGITERLAGLPSAPDAALAESRAIQCRILEVHKLWDFFRRKLALRYVPGFADYLAAADDLAWECYAPVRGATWPADTGAPAAPLVFLTDEFSPYTHVRNDAYDVDVRGMPRLSDSEFAAVAASLPVPVIGVPWYQVAHVPDLPLIAHEAGHDAQHDLEATDPRDEHLAPVLAGLAGRRGAWLTWLDELFADQYGTFCLGTAFVSALADLLATDRASIAQEGRRAAPHVHPPAGVRMRAATEAVRLCGLPDEADTLWRSWTAAYPPDPDDPFIADTPLVVAALDNVRYSRIGGRLRESLSFTPEQHRAAVAEAQNMHRGIRTITFDVRVLVAAARGAYDLDPAGFDQAGPRMRSPRQAVLERFAAIRSDAPRGTAPTGAIRSDREAGRRLLARVDDLIAHHPSTGSPSTEGDGSDGIE